MVIAYDPHLALPILDSPHYTFESNEYIVVANDKKRDVDYTMPWYLLFKRRSSLLIIGDPCVRMVRNLTNVGVIRIVYSEYLCTGY